MWSAPRFSGSAIQWIFVPVFIGPYFIPAFAVKNFGKNVEAREIQDPGYLLRTELASALASRFSVEVIAVRPRKVSRRMTADTYVRNQSLGPEPPDTFEEPKRRVGATMVEVSPDLALDVKTTKWGILGTRWGHYAFDYEATLALTDLRTGKTLAAATCGGLPLDHPDNPTFDELTAAGPARLQSMVGAAGAFCFDDFRLRVLGLHN
ncbi:MAG TPA: hypothetical protein VGG33_22885 [Polyangia bacterium]